MVLRGDGGYDAGDGSSVAAAERARKGVKGLGLQLLDRPVRSASTVAPTLEAVLPDSRDGLLAPPSSSLGILDRLLGLSGRTPAVFTSAFSANAGALVSYGANPVAEGRQAAHLIIRILQGEPAQAIAMEAADKIELVINLKLKTARRLGLGVPDSILSRADRLIRE